MSVRSHRLAVVALHPTEPLHSVRDDDRPANHDVDYQKPYRFGKRGGHLHNILWKSPRGARTARMRYGEPVLIAHDGVVPHIDPTAYVQASAQVIGDVRLGAESSVWFNAVLRGDGFHIRVGARTSIQDNSTVHVATGRHPTVIGDDVTVGHNVVLHACVVGDRCLIGIGAIVLDRCAVGHDCIVGAGALLTPGTVIPPGHLALGSPATVVRPLTDDERAHVLQSARNYVANAARYRAQGI